MEREREREREKEQMKERKIVTLENVDIHANAWPQFGITKLVNITPIWL